MERVWFKEMNPCGSHCRGNHPHAAVLVDGEKYIAVGQDTRAGIHVVGLEFRREFDNLDDAIRYAESRLQ